MTYHILHFADDDHDVLHYTKEGTQDYHVVCINRNGGHAWIPWKELKGWAIETFEIIGSLSDPARIQKEKKISEVEVTFRNGATFRFPSGGSRYVTETLSRRPLQPMDYDLAVQLLRKETTCSAPPRMLQTTLHQQGLMI